MRARIRLERKPHNRSVFPTYLLPVIELGAVDIRNLLQRQLVNRILRVHNYGNGITCDDIFNRVDTVGLRFVDLFLLNFTRRVGNIYGFIDE